MTNSWIRKADQVHEGAADLAARLGKMCGLPHTQVSERSEYLMKKVYYKTWVGGSFSVFTKVLQWEQNGRKKKMSSFPNFSPLTGCLQALITWAELCAPLLQHFNSPVINPPLPSGPSLSPE